MSEKIIRNFKLHIFGDELEEPYLSIYNDLESNFGNLHKYKLNSEGSENLHSIYFGKSPDNLIIQGFSSSKYLWVSHIIINELIDNINKGISFDDICVVIKWFINSRYMLSYERVYTYNFNSFDCFGIEDFENLIVECDI